MKKIFKKILTKLFWGFFRHILSDKKYAQIRYWLELDEWPDIHHPEKFTEKIQHIKLFERTAHRKQAANRIAVRKYIAEKVGDDYLVPLLDIFEKLTPPVWEALPSQFVLKANHGSGMLKIISDKQNEHFEGVRRSTEQWKNTNYFTFGREWAYKDLPRTIVAEKLLLTDDNTIPKDYKFFCFHGEVKAIQIDSDRFGSHQQTLFDRSFNRIDGMLAYPPSPDPIPKPEGLSKAIKVAERLGTDFSFIRVDLYILDGQIYFGELTNYPLNGFISFKPESLEYEMGSFLKL